MSDDRSVTHAEQRPQVDAWGVQVRWMDAENITRTVPDRTLAALHDVIGSRPDDLTERAPIVVRPGQVLPTGPVEVRCEDGRVRRTGETLSEDFPLGYHRVLRPGPERALTVSPGSCWSPTSRAWGWSVQLYAARSRSSWGIGDMSDLRTLREWACGLGAGFLLVSPLHAVAPTLPQEASPYLPATRQFLNPLYLRLEAMAGADTVDIRDLAARGRALNSAHRIDRDAVFRLKQQGLRRIYQAHPTNEDYECWRSGQGVALRRFALWCTLAQRHGPDWRTWPQALQVPEDDRVEALCADHASEVAFHSWLQWALEVQLRGACADMTVIQDLPVGVHGGGADAWAAQDQFASGVTVGAPPDAFSPSGQDWGSPPLVPWRLQQADYHTFVASIRAGLVLTGGLRIDHVLGLFRLWWVPADGSPEDGAYVRYPSRELLDIVALESQRTQALVVGEDLGTVEDGVRASLLEHRVLSYRLLWLDGEEPGQWPELSLAAVTTHDLPTVAGIWTGADLADQLEQGMGTDVELSAGRTQLAARLRPAGLPTHATAEQAVVAAYRLLAQAPSNLLSATLEDAVVEERRPNLPGARARANWCLALKVPIDELMSHPTALAVAAELSDAVNGSP